MPESGTIPWPPEPAARLPLACAIAGVLADHAVAALSIADPRVCRAHTLNARETDLPQQLLDAAPGTTFSGPGVALLIDQADIKWVADAPIAAALRSLATPESDPPP